MQVVGKNHNRIDDKWTFVPSHAKGVPQSFDLLDKNLRTSIGNRYREEVCASWNEISSKADHGNPIEKFDDQAGDHSRIHPAYRFAHAGYMIYSFTKTKKEETHAAS